MIDFGIIPLNTIRPGVYVETEAVYSRKNQNNGRNTTLLIGQRLSTGSVAANRLMEISSARDARVFFGRGSMLAAMIITYLGLFPNRKLSAIAVDDAASSTAATASIALSGTVSAAGVLTFNIAGRDIQVFPIVGQSAATVATALAAAINADYDMPVTAAASSGTVTITARNKGTLGNLLELSKRDIITSAAAYGLAATITAFSGGATDPSLSATLAALGDKSFASYCSPYTDATNLALITPIMAANELATDKDDSLYISAAAGTFSALQTQGNLYNSKYLHIISTKKLPRPIWEFSAAICAIIDRYSQQDPARPFNGLPITGFDPPQTTDIFSDQEREYLLAAGMSTCRTDSRGRYLIEKIISTYKTDPDNFADTTYQSINTCLTLFYLKWDLINRFAAKYPRHKLGNDNGNYAPSAAVLMPKTAKAEMVSLINRWNGLGLIENAANAIATLKVERNDTNLNRLDMQASLNLINSADVIAVKLQFRE